jgi:hypothetical protein
MLVVCVQPLVTFGVNVLQLYARFYHELAVELLLTAQSFHDATVEQVLLFQRDHAQHMAAIAASTAATTVHSALVAAVQTATVSNSASNSASNCSLPASVNVTPAESGAIASWANLVCDSLVKTTAVTTHNIVHPPTLQALVASTTPGSPYPGFAPDGSPLPVAARQPVPAARASESKNQGTIFCPVHECACLFLSVIVQYTCVD